MPSTVVMSNFVVADSLETKEFRRV